MTIFVKTVGDVKDSEYLRCSKELSGPLTTFPRVSELSVI